MKLLSVFSFLLMAATVAGQDNISDCVNTLLDNLRGNPDAMCQHFEDYVRCVILVGDFLHSDRALETLEGVESQVNGHLSQAGCRVDFSQIFNQLKREANAARTSTTPTVRPRVAQCIDLPRWGRRDGCVGLPNGDYQICQGCRAGLFVTCSNGNLHVRNCAPTLGRPLRFDPLLGRCEYYTSYCP